MKERPESVKNSYYIIGVYYGFFVCLLITIRSETTIRGNASSYVLNIKQRGSYRCSVLYRKIRTYELSFVYTPLAFLIM